MCPRVGVTGEKVERVPQSQPQGPGHPAPRAVETEASVSGSGRGDGPTGLERQPRMEESLLGWTWTWNSLRVLAQLGQEILAHGCLRGHGGASIAGLSRASVPFAGWSWASVLLPGARPLSQAPVPSPIPSPGRPSLSRAPVPSPRRPSTLPSPLLGICPLFCPSPRCLSPLPAPGPSPKRPSLSRAPIPSPRHPSLLPSPLLGVRPSPGRPSLLPGTRPLSWASVPSPGHLSPLPSLSWASVPSPIPSPRPPSVSRASVPSPGHLSPLPGICPSPGCLFPLPGGPGHLSLPRAAVAIRPLSCSQEPLLLALPGPDRHLGLGTPCHPQRRCTWSSEGRCRWARCWGQSTLATNAWLPSPADHASGWIMPGAVYLSERGRGGGPWRALGPWAQPVHPPAPAVSRPS